MTLVIVVAVPDGRKPFPINHGPSTPEGFLQVLIFYQRVCWSVGVSGPFIIYLLCNRMQPRCVNTSWPEIQVN